jgi:hypothetical protein
VAGEPQRSVQQPADGVSFYFADEDLALVARAREHHMTMLRGIPQERRDAAERERAIVRYARQLGISWDDIAAAVGGSAG